MSRLTIRTRLTLVYGGLFLLAGVALLGVTYLLVSATSLAPSGFRLPETPDAPTGGVGAGTASR